MKCWEAEDLYEAYGESAEAFRLAIDALVKGLAASRAEFWSALKIAESAKEDCNDALRAIDLHILNHKCTPN